MVVRTEDTRDNYNLLSADILYFTKSNKNKINFAIEHFICLYNHILSALKMVSK